MPNFSSRMEYVKAIYERYHKVSRHEKTRILEEFCRVNDYNRKYAIRLLNSPLRVATRLTRQRRYVYPQALIDVAETFWKAAGYPCGDRLKEILPLWLPSFHQRARLSEDMERQLLSISARQLDARLAPQKRLWKKRIYSTTRPGSLLKRMIPIRTSNWDIRQPGFLEIDLVAHCGNSAAGHFIYTLNATDLATGWTECRAVLGKGKYGVLEGLKHILPLFPFPIEGIDSDNGEEFINYHLLSFCLQSHIQFTRSRAYKKDDNAHIEQKNWTRVRQAVGWNRYDSEQALAAMNDLYSHELRLLENLFQPSAKLCRRSRVGSRRVRHHDRPQTPFQRLLSHGVGDPLKIDALKRQLASLNPFQLSETIELKIDRLGRLASASRPIPVVTPPRYDITLAGSVKRRNQRMASLKRRVMFSH